MPGVTKIGSVGFLFSAKKLLKDTDIPVNEVGDRVGYTTSRGFFSAFKKYEGISPGEYRKKHKE